MGAFIDITGNRYGNLTVIKRAPNRGKQTMWLCSCDCGNTVVVAGGHLKSGHTKSCGCLQGDLCGDKNPNYKHGGTSTKLYYTFNNMLRRCYEETNDHFQYYGGRGIGVCDEWRNNFKAFMEWALSNGYTDHLTIDRIDVNRDYSPDNCRWCTYAEQALNRTDNRYLTYDGKTMTMKEWSDAFNIPYRALNSRINKYNWSVEKALTTPLLR